MTIVQLRNIVCRRATGVNSLFLSSLRVVDAQISLFSLKDEHEHVSC